MRIPVAVFTALLSCLFFRTDAQDTNGYVVTVRNDTLYGDVRINSIQELNQSITLKGADKKKQVFTPNTARAYKIKEDIYHSVHLRDHYVFMKVIQAGYMSVYEHELMSRQSNGTEINDYIKIGLGELISVPKISFRKKIAPLLTECPSVAAKVEQKDYGFTDLKVLAVDFNQCVANKPAPKPVSVTTVVPTPTANPTIQELLTYLSNNPQTANLQDLKSCLNDINAKIASGATVPNYLLNALVNLTQGTEAIQEKALKIATDLGYQPGK